MMERNENRSTIWTLIDNTSHINEHDGTIVTSVRLNTLVPPNTAARLAKSRAAANAGRSATGVRSETPGA